MRTKVLLSLVVSTAAVMLTGIIPAHAQDGTYARTYAVTPKGRNGRAVRGGIKSP